MFCDLVGSTALSARMDPEDLREVISAYQNALPSPYAASAGSSPSTWATACSSISAIRKPTRTTPSARCGPGLELVAAVTALKTALPLQMRVGIATGLVVVGDLIGSGAAQEQASSARRRTLRRACRGSPSRTQSSSPTAPEGFSAIFSSLRTWGQDLKGIAGPRGPGRRCGRVRWKAASRLCTRAA